MKWAQRVSQSFVDAFKNPSILLVLVLEFLFASLLLLLFFLLSTSILSTMGMTTLPQSPQELINELLTPRMLALSMLLLSVQGVILVLIDSFFKAGAFGMIKNAIQDGTTTFKEFMPNAKRYVWQLFGFQIIRYIMLLAVSAPFIWALLSYMGTTPGFATSQQTIAMVSTAVIAGIGVLLILFVLLYGEALIVFKDEASITALKKSVQLVSSNIGFSLGVGATFLALGIVAGVLESLLLLPFTLMIEQNPATSIVLMHDIASFLFSIISIVAGIIGTFFLFRSYILLAKPTKKSAKRK